MGFAPLNPSYEGGSAKRNPPPHRFACKRWARGRRSTDAIEPVLAFDHIMIVDKNGGMVDQPSARIRLAAELAVGLARRLWMALGPDATDAGFCWHSFQNPFVDGCHVLWELGVALADTGSADQGMTWQQYAKQHPSEQGPGSFKFFPAAETRAGVLAYGELPDALFGRLLAAYVGNACIYGPDGTQLCSGHEPFKPAAEFEREIGALVECGYAERCGDMVKWTDKIAAVMRAEHCRDDPRPRIKTLPQDGAALDADAFYIRGEVPERVNRLVQDGNPIAAMALIRAETGAGLLECKAYVEDLVRKNQRSQ
jgi:hypothetical protein